MANFFNILNRKIIINSSKISNPSLKDAIILNSERVTGDLSSIASYNNQVVYEVFRKLCSKPEYPYDAIESGLSGNTIVTYLEEDGNNSFNSPIYWSEDQNRPNTIKESFDYVISNLGIQEIIRENESPDLGNIIAQIRCTQKNLNKLRKDTIGCNDEYFTCSDQPELEWPISKHLYELFTQGIITGHNQGLIADLNNICDPAGTEYPELKLTIKTDGIEEGASLIPQRFIEGCEVNLTLEDQLDQIQEFVGMQCMESLSELAQCATLQITNQRSLKAYIEKILERLCSLGDEGIDAVYLGVRDPEVGEDRNIEGISEGTYNPLKTGSSLVYYHSSELEKKKHWFKLNGDESFVEGLFVPDSYVKTADWTNVDYSNPIPYTLFTYASNPNLDVNYVNTLRSLTFGKRSDSKLNSLCLFEEITSYEEQTIEKYNYEQIGGVIRNDLTIADKDLDTGSTFLKYADSLEDYHLSSGTEDYRNHLQNSGHAPVICIGPVDFGDILVPAPLRLQQQVVLGDDRNYGFVCSRKVLSEPPVAGLYTGDPNWSGNISDLNYKVGISLSSNKDLIEGSVIHNSLLALTYHQDIINNIILKAKPNLSVNDSPSTVYGANPYAYLSIQYMRIML